MAASWLVRLITNILGSASVNIINKIKRLIYLFKSLDSRLDNIQNALGRVELRQNELEGDLNIVNSEFKVYSQWGEDGIIQHILNHIRIDNPIFVEFGVETYTESNTRFLLKNNNWSGLIIDGSEKNINFIKSDSIYWKHNLKVECSFITKDNINQLIEQNGITGDIGLLSVDIDGNDYWVWQAIDIINPAIIISEYNSLWGYERAVTTPYDPNFIRGKQHYSNLYYGASVKALTLLASKKGYSLVAGNQAGNNLFFVRNDLLNDLNVISEKEAWVQSQFRESRDLNGQLTYLPFQERLALLADMPLIDVERNTEVKVSDLQ